ncbi:MAG: dockerin type I repeat-containing protein [Clostridia bacterium]|nr:dockerin type I repeat-containing protein [Clostridia bacterium]
MIKKIFIGIVAFTLCVNLTAFATSLFPIGDVTFDGTVNSLDAAQVLKHDAKLISLEGEGLVCADYNGDGAVDNLDAAGILRYDAGLTGDQNSVPGPKTVINIVDDSYGKAVGEAYQYFYEDETYAYFFYSYIGEYITVFYSNGDKEDLITAFENGRVTVEDLDRFGIHYEKEHRFYSYGANRFDWTAVMEGAYIGVENELERITEGFVNIQPIDIPLPVIDTLEAAEERARAEYPNEYRHVVFSYDDAKEVFCVAFYETPSLYDTTPYQCVYMDKVGVTLLITKCIPYVIECEC